MNKKMTQSISGLIRTRLDQYTLRKYNGEKHIVFVNELIEEGFEIKGVTVFNTLLNRARMADKKKGEVTTNKNYDNQKEKSATEKKVNILSKPAQKVISQAEITEMFKQEFDASKL